MWNKRATAGRARALAALLPAIAVSGSGNAQSSVQNVEVKKAHSILDLQESKTESVLNLKQDGDRPAFVKLINLNPSINASFLLEINPGRASRFFNILNTDPGSQKLTLDTNFPQGITLQIKDHAERCPLWDDTGKSLLTDLLKPDNPYKSICDGKLMLLVQVEGRSSMKEIVTDFLRRNVWQGEKITTLVKDTIFKDGFLKVPEESRANAAEATQTAAPRRGPEPARINQKDANILLKAESLNIPLKDKNLSALPIAEWMDVTGHPGVFVSVMEAGHVADDILKSHTEIVDPLDNIEKKALVISVAYDLGMYDLGFLVGTEHPSLNWSVRANPSVRPKGWAGPDGFEKREPIVSPGMVPPFLSDSVISTFTSGFKRYHSAFRWGQLAQINRGSHYGMIENGVLHSRLNPGLATLTIDHAGRVDMRTWTPADDASIPKLRHARQNGVPILQWDEKARAGIPGSLVSNWGQGNWSGADNKTMRALRAGICLQEFDQRRYLIYGYFTSVTPGAMARVFQSYNCRYAMHLDMNALEHTYLAVYNRDAYGSRTYYLDAGMKVLDESGVGVYVPRFVGMPDNRDFFYLTPKTGSK